MTGDRRQLETQYLPRFSIFVEHLDAIGPTRRLSLKLHTGGCDTAGGAGVVGETRGIAGDKLAAEVIGAVAVEGYD